MLAHSKIMKGDLYQEWLNNIVPKFNIDIISWHTEWLRYSKRLRLASVCFRKWDSFGSEIPCTLLLVFCLKGISEGVVLANTACESALAP